jgi:hypothetical protein
MSGWEVGDLALCVDVGPAVWAGGKIECDGTYIGKLKKGCVYRVARIGKNEYAEALMMECGAGGFVHRFRKIKPDTEPCEEEFTVLIKRGRKVQA